MIKVDNVAEFICDRCNGSCYEPGPPYGHRYHVVCNKCLGHGKLDWIERVIGKRKPKIYMDNTPLHTHYNPFTGHILPRNNVGSHTHSCQYVHSNSYVPTDLGGKLVGEKNTT